MAEAFCLWRYKMLEFISAFRHHTSDIARMNADMVVDLLRPQLEHQPSNIIHLTFDTASQSRINKKLYMFNLDKFISNSVTLGVVNRFSTLLIVVVLFTACSDIDPSIANTPFGMTSIHYEFIIILLSMIAGWGMIIGGIVLMLLGLTGEVEFFIDAVDFKARILNASPGLVLTLIGAYVVLKSRMDIKAHKGDGRKENSEPFS